MAVVKRVQICACYRSRDPIARICDTGSRYGRLDLRAGVRPQCVPRMRTYIGVSSDRVEKGAREEGPRVRASREDARHRRRRRDGVPAVIHVLCGRLEELRA